VDHLYTSSDLNQRFRCVRDKDENTSIFLHIIHVLNLIFLAFGYVILMSSTTLLKPQNLLPLHHRHNLHFFSFQKIHSKYINKKLHLFLTRKSFYFTIAIQTL